MKLLLENDEEICEKARLQLENLAKKKPSEWPEGCHTIEDFRLFERIVAARKRTGAHITDQAGSQEEKACRVTPREDAANSKTGKGRAGKKQAAKQEEQQDDSNIKEFVLRYEDGRTINLNEGH